MKLMNLVDAGGRRHSIDPLSITGIREDDVGVVLTIVLHETVEVMCDALSSHGINSERIAAVNSAGQRGA